MSRRQAATIIVAVIVAGTSAVVAVVMGFGGHPARVTSSPPTGGTSASEYAYYLSEIGKAYGGRSMMGSSYGPMMGSSPYGWMMGRTGYAWMIGGATAPGWMRGGTLPGFMMGTSHDPGEIMGRFWADAPGPRVSAAQAAVLGDAVPPGATVDRAADRISFSGTAVRVAVLASPPGGRDETFRIAGLTNPAITVRQGTRVTIEVINADPDTAHGLVITARTASSWMPMMTAAPAFAGAAAWFLGDPTAAGMHAATLTLTAVIPGTYQYLCPVPGHAARGMAGTFTVTGTT